ncbi:MAG TPA: hypothetical protein VIM11_22120 [Tepidisphaeraceae bacterium]|jgi:hypothetical protein
MKWRRRRRYPLYPALAWKIVLSGMLVYALTGASNAIVWPVEVTGNRTGFHVALTPAAIQIWVGWGWPNRYWIEHREGGDFWKGTAYGSYESEWGHECFGFLLGHRGGSYYAMHHKLAVHWIILGVPWWFIGALIFWRNLARWQHRIVIRKRAARRMRNRLRCAGCGYDLRATPLRCPECGRRVE